MADEVSYWSYDNDIPLELHRILLRINSTNVANHSLTTSTAVVQEQQDPLEDSSSRYYQCVGIFLGFLVLLIACFVLLLRALKCASKRHEKRQDCLAQLEAAKQPPSYDECLRNPQLFPAPARLTPRPLVLESAADSSWKQSSELCGVSAAAPDPEQSPPAYRSLFFWLRQISTSSHRSGVVQSAPASPTGPPVFTTAVPSQLSHLEVLAAGDVSSAETSSDEEQRKISGSSAGSNAPILS